VLAATTAAVAGGDNRPQVDQVTAEIVFTHVKGKTRQCEGQDGMYAENRLTFTGTSTGDPRLAGDVEMEFHELVNFTQEAGPMAGRLSIRDPASGQRKVNATIDGTGPLDMVQGVIVGRAQDEGGGGEETTGSGDLYANFRLNYSDTGVSMEIGGETGDTRLPATISSGECKGKFEEVDEPIGPAPAVAKTAANRWSRR
jgi:hypothetical protein